MVVAWVAAALRMPPYSAKRTLAYGVRLNSANNRLLEITPGYQIGEDVLNYSTGSERYFMDPWPLHENKQVPNLGGWDGILPLAAIGNLALRHERSNESGRWKTRIFDFLMAPLRWLGLKKKKDPRWKVFMDSVGRRSLTNLKRYYRDFYGYKPLVAIAGDGCRDDARPWTEPQKLLRKSMRQDIAKIMRWKPDFSASDQGGMRSTSPRRWNFDEIYALGRLQVKCGMMLYLHAFEYPSLALENLEKRVKGPRDPTDMEGWEFLVEVAKAKIGESEDFFTRMELQRLWPGWKFQFPKKPNGTPSILQLVEEVAKAMGIAPNAQNR